MPRQYTSTPDPHRLGHRRRAATLIVVSALGLTAAMAGSAAAVEPTEMGPSTTTPSYVLPIADGVHITSLLTVGDGAADNGYEMVGIPDGLGMIRQGANLVLYSNHELADSPSVQGIVRRHGQAAAFVSRWVIDPVTLRFKEGADWINPGIQYYDYPTGTYVTSGARFADSTVQDLTFGRFCSGTLSDPDIFYNPATKAGYRGQISHGRTPSRPQTTRTRPWSSVTRTARPTAASCGSTSARSSAAVRRSRRRA
jgi:hypothetical protein